MNLTKEMEKNSPRKTKPKAIYFLTRQYEALEFPGFGDKSYFKLLYVKPIWS